MEINWKKTQMVGRATALLPWFRDPEVTDILINGPGSLFVEKAGELRQVPSPFETSQQIEEWIERLLIPIGKRLDASRPYVDGRMLDGNRFHILMPPLSVGGPLISIRKFRPEQNEVALEDFCDGVVAEWLRKQMQERKNILIVGGTGAGKTTLLSCLLREVPAKERVILIEETTEIRSLHPHQINLEARAATPEGFGEVTLGTLLRNALRMRPDRLVLGECRGAEAFELLQAMNTGHSGSLSTIHANSCRQGLRRLELLLLLGCATLSISVAREWISSVIHILIYLGKEDGKREIREIQAVVGLEGGVFRLAPVLKPACDLGQLVPDLAFPLRRTAHEARYPP